MPVKQNINTSKQQAYYMLYTAMHPLTILRTYYASQQDDPQKLFKQKPKLTPPLKSTEPEMTRTKRRRYAPTTLNTCRDS